MRTAAEDAGFLFHDPNAAYEGHRICNDDSYLNAAALFSSSGSSLWVNSVLGHRDIPGSGSYHPKASGHAAIADDVRQLLGL